MSPRLELEVDRDLYAPGEVVRCTVSIVEGGKSRSLEAAMRYTEKTRDYSHFAVELTAGRLHEGDLHAGETFVFEFALPADSLPAYASKHGELFWEIDVKSDEPGRDTHVCQRVDVRVGPSSEGWAGEPSWPQPSSAEGGSVWSNPGSSEQSSDQLG